MQKLGISIRLRPIRFAFLVKPDDARNLQRIFEINTSLWGGTFNPIIPYFTRVPTWWEGEPHPPQKAKRILNGYFDFFEPDFVVEAERGLAVDYNFDKESILQLDDMLEHDRDSHNIDYGLNVFDLYKKLYREEFQFVRRHEHRIVHVTAKDKSFELFTSCVFGAFPREKRLEYISRGYQDAFNPECISLDADTLANLYRKSFTSPLQMGQEGIEIYEHRHREPTLFILDAKRPRDLVDYWNLRAISRDVIPIPLQWLDILSPLCRDFITRNYRPLPGNPHGVMIHTTVHFARSLSEETIQQLYQDHLRIDAPEAASIQTHSPDFQQHPSDLVYGEGRPALEVTKKQLELTLDSDEKTILFETVSPDFVDRYMGRYSWANIINLEDKSYENQLATIFPCNYRAPELSQTLVWGHRLLSTSEGLVIFPQYPNAQEHWHLLDGTSVFTAWFKKQGISAHVSDVGRLNRPIFLDRFLGLLYLL